MKADKKIPPETRWQLIGILSLLFALIMTLRIQYVSGVTWMDYSVRVVLSILVIISIIKYQGIL